MSNVIYFTDYQNNCPIKDFLDLLEEKQQAKILRLFALIKNYNLNSILPHIKKLKGTPLWEIRILGKDSIRIIYMVPEKDLIIILHGFIKKTQKTPQKELNIAFSRYKYYLTMTP